MAVFVVDASVALTWCFRDESNDWSDAFLERLRHGDRIVVPAHWPAEIANALLVALRRKRISPGQPELLWEALTTLPIEIQPALNSFQVKEVLALCQRHGVTVYDGAYVELARRRQLPIASLDADLCKAALAEGISLL